MVARKKISAVAQELNINSKTIRYYEEIGLIPRVPRSESGHRIFSQTEIDRIAFVLRARALDFSLKETRDILSFHEDCQAPCSTVGHLVQHKISKLETKIKALQKLQEELENIAMERHNLSQEENSPQNCICNL